jgi:hypothetical protein
MYKDGFQFIKGPGAAPEDFCQRPAQRYKDTPILIEDTTPTDSPIGESPEHEEEKDMTTNGNGVNWEMVTENKGNPDDPLWFIKSPGKALAEDYQAAIDLALDQGALIRDAETKFGKAKIKQRHEGLLHRENADDRQRIDALKANHDRKVLSGDHLKELGELVAAGLEFVMDVSEYLENRNAVRPASLQPLGNALNQATIKILTGALIESAKLNAETGNQEIVRATPPGQRQK